MTAQRVPFGVLLRRWRTSRRMTQSDLALAANSSTRHLSYLETGRSQPSRDMILRLSEHLGIPLRDQNTLLLAAGFAPAFEERSLAELASARVAIEQILKAHRPYPAFALDRHWNVVLSNSALPQLYEGCSPDLLRKPINAVRLILHPRGMAPRIVNFIESRAHDHGPPPANRGPRRSGNSGAAGGGHGLPRAVQRHGAGDERRPAALRDAAQDRDAVGDWSRSSTPPRSSAPRPT
jgi:transcriptional regulator with XRE-family HTH domain